MNQASLITMIEDWERLPVTLSRVPHEDISSSVRLSRRSTWNIDSSRKLFLRKCSLYRSCENNFVSLLRRDSRARLPSGLSIITLAYNICTRVVYVHTGWSSIVLNVQSADNVPGGQPTLPTNLAIVRATSRAPYIRFLGVWARFCRKSPDPEIS